MTTTVSEKPELEIAERLVELLRPFGSVSMQYISAEMQPHTNQFKPDVVFVPKNGGYAGQIVVIEPKMNLKYPQRFFESLGEHRRFFEEYLEKEVSRYLVATSVGIDELLAKRLANDKVLAIGNVKAAEDITAALKELGILN